jgi:hypothetical protein
MTDDILIAGGCAGAFILVLLLVAVFLILRRKPFTYRKKTTDKNTTLTIVANRNLHKVTVEARFGGDSIKFERKRIRKGQTVDFTYPASNKPTKITVEADAGKPKVSEV